MKLINKLRGDMRAESMSGKVIAIAFALILMGALIPVGVGFMTGSDVGVINADQQVSEGETAVYGNDEYSLTVNEYTTDNVTFTLEDNQANQTVTDSYTVPYNQTAAFEQSPSGDTDLRVVFSNYNSADSTATATLGVMQSRAIFDIWNTLPVILLLAVLIGAFGYIRS